MTAEELFELVLAEDLGTARDLAARLIAFLACERGDGRVRLEALDLAREARRYVGP